MYQSRIKESPMKIIGPPMQGITMNQTSQGNCNLCGTLGSSVKCDRCDCKTFCMSCDDMYHRHPKRRFHLRKAINPVNPMSQRCDNVSTSVLRPLQATLSPSPSPSLSSLSSSNNHSEMKSTAIKSTQFQATATPHHPSKMPIPPPRRKKKLLEDQNRPFLPQFGQTRLIQYQPGSNSQSVDQINQSGRYFNEQQQQQQMRLNYNYLRPFEEEYQRESLNNGAGSSNLSSANSSSLSSEQWSSEVGSSGNVPPALPIKKKWSQSLPRKNLSLMDLTSSYMNPNPNGYYAGAGSPMHMMPGQMMNPSLPPNYPMSYSPTPYHPHHPGPYNMTSVSLAQSMEDLGLDDGEDQVSDADFPDHGTLTRNKSHLSSMMSRRNGSMKRSQSSFLVNNQWQQKQQQMVQPYWMNPVYPMYPGYPMMPGTHHPPLPPSSPYNNARASPSPSLRSLNMNRKTRSVSSREQSVRSSVARETSPAMGRKSSSSSHHQHHSSQSRNKSFDQRSTSIPRSLTSSRYSMRASESDEEDDGNQMRRKHADNTDDDEGDYACQSDEEEDNEDEDEDEDDRYSQASSLEPNKWWHCYACTYVNKPNSDICEMCGKSHPSRLKKMRNKAKVTKEPVKESKPNQSNRNGPEVVITTDLIREQMEIEKELRRRLENEKRIERENRRLEKKEEKKRNQYLSTPSIDENYDVGDNNISNPLIPSTSNSSVIPATTTIRTESIQRVDSIRAKNDSKVSYKTNKNSNSTSSMNNDHYEGDHYLNKNNVSQVKASGNIEDELDWPDSVISSGDKNRKKEGERSFSSPTNFQDIEATFAKLEQEIDSIRNSNKKETGNKDISLDENKTNEPKKTDDNTKSNPQVSLKDANEKPKVQPSTASNIGASSNQETEKITKSNNNESSEIKTETTSAQNNESKTTVDEKASDTTIPTNNSPQMVNQPASQSTQLVPSSQIPMSLPTIYQQSGQQMYPPFTNQYPMMGQQLTPINSGTAFPNYDVNRLRSNSYVGLNSPPTDIINNPLAIYASNYQPPGSSMYNYPMNNLPLNQSSPHMILDSNSFSFRSDQNALHNMGQLGGFNSKYMSKENLSIDNRSNQGLPSMGTQGVATVSSAQSQLQSGFQMFKLLRDAEKKGFTADDIEIALTFNSTSPLDWLDENWNNMVETVLTLSNNQLVQNEKKRLGKKYKLTAIDLVTTKDAKSALRSTKGNIWQAIDKCVQKKEDDKTVDKKDIKSFSLDIEESGSGKSNMDAVPINLLSSNEASQNLKAKSPTFNEKDSKQDEISISRSSSSSGEYFSEVSEENDSDTDGRLLNVEVRNFDAFDETEEIETQGTEAKDEQELEADEVNEVEEHDEYEEEEDEDEVDEDVDNEELVRLRSDSFEGDEDNDNDKNVDEDETEMEDYENLRRSLEQRLTQLGLNSIDEYIDDSDEDKEDDKEDGNKDKDNEFGQEFEILNKDDFSSNDSDKWSEQSSEQSSDQDKDNEVIDQLALPRQPVTKERSISPLTIDLEETLKSSVECLETLYRTSLQTDPNTSNQLIDENQLTTINEPGPSQETKTSNKLKEKLKKGLKKKVTKELANRNKEKDKQLQDLNPSATSTSLSKDSSDNGKGQQTLIPAIPITSLPVIDKESLNPHFGYARSAYECELCAGSFHIRDMVSLISCTHKACINCLRQYFAVQIREAQVFIITCPFCSEPSMSPDDEDSVCDYLSLLDQLVKSLVTADLHELWQRKVRDKVLSKDPSFSWCTNCSSGFIASNPAAKTITCPDCQIVTCASCHKVWEEQHNGITCEQFTEWKRLNDPEYSENQLDLHLKQFGIDCPNCHFHYELSKGGCMHFHCIQCSHDFCGGCRQPFRLGSKCSVSNWCDKLGLHAHHPRNCLFYLRDKEVDELRKLLDMNNVEYKYNEDKQSTNESRVCMIMEQKEYPEGLKDMPCGSNLETAGVCKQHYIEYLGGLIFEHGIDPIEIFTEDELIHVLRRSNVTLPTKKYGQDYRNILCETIKKECPLIKDPIK
ncbi:LOW QUALITY PROTEIN: uncharacterized protein LOC107366537 [Tetranychus urticae]|uniref:LOW QUALITY PROTEIN: uncharacterized protein LOC107366537 n=1 Tax=Tetranychus urticae TaxID=32264 RepID=UPI000D6592EB|nr:LOW QUALITY PROTEIN: uncharacterized protein LOC107366537 [Tetranychus urticae]